MPNQKITREEIIRKSLQVFIQKGYYHTSISDLAKVCGVEKPHIYYYFRDKRDLMRSILVYFKEWIRKYTLSYAFDDTLGAAQKLNRILSAVKKVHSKEFVGCLFGNTVLETSGLEQEFEPVLKEYFQMWVDTLSVVYQQKYNQEKSTQVAEQFVSEMQGTILMMKLYRSASIFERFMSAKLKEFNH